MVAAGSKTELSTSGVCWAQPLQHSYNVVGGANVIIDDDDDNDRNKIIMIKQLLTYIVCSIQCISVRYMFLLDCGRYGIYS